MTKAEGISVCFDLEAGAADWIAFSDDEINESTKCNVCVRVSENGKWITSQQCREGVKNRASTHRFEDCVDTGELYDIDAVDYYVQTDCGDGMWLDVLKVKVPGNTPGYGERWYGEDNNVGYCLSTDAGDHDKFRAHTNGKCYQTLIFKAGQYNKVGGWAAGTWQPNLLHPYGPNASRRRAYDDAGVEVCFDLEATNRDIIQFQDDEINESTKCNICTRVAKNGHWITSKQCKSGVKNKQEWDCIDTVEKYDFNAVDIYVQTDCGDGMWLDRLEVKYSSGKTYGGNRRFWGKNNNRGWCLSTDAGDHDGFRAKTNGKCYQTLKFQSNGNTSGWTAGSWQPTLRRLAGMPGNMLDLPSPDLISDGEELSAASEELPAPSEELSVAPEELSVAESEELVGFTAGEELAVPMEHLPARQSTSEDLVGFTEGEELAVPMERLPAGEPAQPEELFQALPSELAVPMEHL